MSLEIYSFIFFVLFSCIICIIMLLGGWLLGSKTVSRSKNIPFESGIIAFGDTHLKFSVKFYLLAVLFVIFDVESLYLYAWVTNIINSGWIGFFEILFFIFILLLSLGYLMKERVFHWVPKKSENIF